MSRVDDDRQAQRAAERVLQQMRRQENRAQEKATESAFARLVQGQEQLAQGKTAKLDEALDFNKLLQEAGAEGQETSHADDKSRFARVRTQARQGHSLDHKVRHGDAHEAEQAFAEKGADETHTDEGMASRAKDFGAAQGAEHARAGDAQKSSEGLSEKGADMREGALASGSSGGPKKLKTEGDQGRGQGGNSQGGDQSNKGDVPAGFRFNPALMAPVPVARPKDAAGSARLRALAQEIAQKIVEHVRVGTNAEGISEFQIDLRSNVLSGLSIKVAGRDGKIRATFLGSDREVLKMLREQADGLKSALEGRGLTLEDLRIEERA